MPAGLIGLPYTYILIKKTRLEARRTEFGNCGKGKATPRFDSPISPRSHSVLTCASWPVVHWRASSCLGSRYYISW